MPVGMGDVLHVLAHELRTPTGIAQGYIRLLLDDRLAADDKRRVLEQMQRALARISELTEESSRLASWFDPANRSATAGTIAARELVDGVRAQVAIEPPLLVDAALDASSLVVNTIDSRALVEAVADVVKVTAREMRGRSCTLAAQTIDNTSALELLVGDAARFATLRSGPGSTDAVAPAVERGGVGLALIRATVVLDEHHAQVWTMNNARTAVGIRLGLEGVRP